MTAAELIKNYKERPLRIMEVCGTHTHEIFRLGLRSLLPPQVELISGPGCPVCVTPVSYIDEAVWLAREKKVTVMTFGDLIRVPGSCMSLSDCRSEGGKIRVVYSPIDAVRYAAEHRKEQVVFLSVGFETTTPSACLAAEMAEEEGLTNFSLLTANKTMPMAYRSLMDSVDVYLYPGHVHTVTGTALCREMLEKDGVSGVVAGFTASELTAALAVAVVKGGQGKPFFVNAYSRVVKDEGNPTACALVEKMMEPCDAVWRGLGLLPGSGMQLKETYALYDARKKYEIPAQSGRENPVCRCGDVLRGSCRPSDCPVFGRGCTPEHPIGACMVSGEGSCSAFYQYGGVIK